MPTRDLPFGLRPTGFGGGEIKARLGTARSFSFAGVNLANRDTIVGGRIAGYDGLFGQELMQAFDIELDFANGVMRFWRRRTAPAPTWPIGWSTAGRSAPSTSPRPI